MASTYRAPIAAGEVYDPRQNRMSDILRAGSEGLSDSAGFMVGPHYVTNYGAILKPFTNLAANYFKQKEDTDIAALDKQQLADWTATAPTGSIKQGMGPLMDQSNIAPPTRADRQTFLLRGMNLSDPEMSGAVTKAYLNDAVNPKQRTPYVTNLTSGFQVDPDTGEVVALPQVQAYNEEMKASQFEDRAALKQMVIDASQGRLSQSIGAQDRRQQAGFDFKDQYQRNEVNKATSVHATNRDYDLTHQNPADIALKEGRARILEQTLADKQKIISNLKPMSLPTEKTAQGVGDIYKDLNMLRNTFKDQYSGNPLKKLATKGGSLAGGLATEKIQEHTQWWSLNNRLAVIPERLKAFGATLTPAEQASWDLASVNESTKPNKIRANFTTRMGIIQEKLRGIRDSEKVAGRNYKQIDAYMGNLAKDMWPDEISSNAPTEAGTGQRALSPTEMARLVKTESSGNSDAVSPAGAKGITQIMPETAKNPGFGMEPINLSLATDAEKIDWSNRYIAAMMNKLGMTKTQAVSAYHMGPGNVQKADGAIVDPAYVNSILPKSSPPKRVLTKQEMLDKY